MDKLESIGSLFLVLMVVAHESAFALCPLRLTKMNLTSCCSVSFRQGAGGKKKKKTKKDKGKM